MTRPQTERPAGQALSRNVGGSDFVTRVVACLSLTALLWGVLPVAAPPWSALKLSLRTGAELGVVLLMVGLFFKAKTYFAGAHLFFTSLLMLFLCENGLGWVALALGTVSIAFGAIDLITRKSRFNALFGVSSWRDPSPAPPVAPHPHPLTTH